MRPKNSALMAAALMSMVASQPALTEAVPALRIRGGGSSRRPAPPAVDDALRREIAEHNYEVERRKAEKRAAKLARR